jgi:hypothetical protein
VFYSGSERMLVTDITHASYTYALKKKKTKFFILIGVYVATWCKMQNIRQSNIKNV